MKFNNYDELLTYLKDKTLSTLNFEITEEQQASDVPTSVAPTVAPTIPATSSKVNVAFDSLSNKPVLEFQVGEKSILVVNEFEHIPNTCSTSVVEFDGREIIIGVCESADGLPVAKFDVTIDGKLYGRKEFILTTDAVNNINTININD